MATYADGTPLDSQESSSPYKIAAPAIEIAGAVFSFYNIGKARRSNDQVAVGVAGGECWSIRRRATGRRDQVRQRPPNAGAPDIVGWGCWNTKQAPCICGYDGGMLTSWSTMPAAPKFSWATVRSRFMGMNFKQYLPRTYNAATKLTAEVEFRELNEINFKLTLR